MRIAVLGGGITGLAAAHTIARSKKHSVTIFEEAQSLGGLASGFRGEGWDWSLEKAYHHIFSSDKHIIRFLQDLGYEGITFHTPITASLYKVGNKFQTFAVDTPLNLLRFPLLGIQDKIRAGLTLGIFKTSPFLKIYERHTTEKLLKYMMGEKAFETLFGEMFRKKFGKYAGKIVGSFIWSRIHMRTKNLGYMQGGFQDMVDFVGRRCEEQGVDIKLQRRVQSISTNANKTFSLTTEDRDGVRVEEYDFVISTLPSSILADVAADVLNKKERQQLQQIHHLSAVNLILEMDTKIFDKEYWVSLCTPEIPGLVFVQHTNLVNSSRYQNHHILYIASYCEKTDPRMSMSKEELLALYLPTLHKIAKKQFTIHNAYIWRAHNAQPIFDSEFLSAVPQFTTSNPRFFIANLDMTYPYDRGTNYAVKLGVDVAALALTSTAV